jgi:hypothetical protein
VEDSEHVPAEMAVKFEAAIGNSAGAAGGRATVLHAHAEMSAQRAELCRLGYYTNLALYQSIDQQCHSVRQHRNFHVEIYQSPRFGISRYIVIS